MKCLFSLVAAGHLLLILLATPKDPAQEQPVFRAPFVLRLHADKDHYYEQKFDRIPYVANNEIYMFAGESFGVRVTEGHDEPFRISYERNLGKADIVFNFSQHKASNSATMLLLIRNNMKRTVHFDAHMTVPGRQEIYETGLLPVKPGLENVESWPHPIVQLKLGNLRLSDEHQEAR